MLNKSLHLRSTLSQSKSSFLAAHLRPSGKPYASLVVAATIFHPTTDKILLLKRSPAEKLFPHHWEIPGGKVDDTDKTIWDALKREVHEETGLSIKKSDIIQGEMGFEWALGKDVKDGTEMALELNFMVEIKKLPEEVKLDPEEHLESLWANERDIVGLKMTPEMRCVVEDALDCLQSRRRSARDNEFWGKGFTAGLGLATFLVAFSTLWVGLGFRNAC